MSHSHDRNGTAKQAIPALICLLLSGATAQTVGERAPKSHDEKKSDRSEEPLRFGDPESEFFQEETEQKNENTRLHSRVPVETKQPSSKKSAPSPIMSIADWNLRVREIVETVPPGQSFEREFKTLVSFGSPATPALAQIFSDPAKPWHARWLAGMVMGRLGGTESRLVLLQGLKDPLFLIRMAAARALGQIGDEGGDADLREALNDPAMVVRATVAEALGRRKDKGSVALLTEELSADRNFHRGRSLWVRDEILRALGEIGDDSVIPKLVETLSDRDPKIRQRTCTTLARLAPAAPPAVATQREDCANQWLSWNLERSRAKQEPSTSVQSFPQ